jgi:hypothetical protein
MQYRVALAGGTAGPGEIARLAPAISNHEAAHRLEDDVALGQVASRDAAVYCDNDLQLARAELYERADETITASSDCIGQNGLDQTVVEACCGVLGVCPLRFFEGTRFGFDFADDGEPGAVIEALDADDETSIDLIGWPVSRPDRFASVLGVAEGLGLARVRNPATYLCNQPLRVFRTPLQWLQAGGVGAVMIDLFSAPRWLPDAPFIAGEDDEHARELARLLHPYYPPERILVPVARAA